MNRPDFLIIGAARSGTSALASHLSQHSNIHFTTPKETHFLAFSDSDQTFSGPGDDVTINPSIVRDPVHWQELLAAPDGMTRGEGSVSTLYYHDQTIANIDAVCPDARFIVMLRDPLDRAMSAHSYLQVRGYETEDFAQGLELERERVGQGYHHLWHYRGMSRYADAIEAFVRAFGAERLLVLDFDEFERAPWPQVERAVEFLSLVAEPPSIDPELRINSSNDRSKWVTLAEGAARRSGRLRWIVRRTVPFAIRERIRSQGRRPDYGHELDAETVASFYDEVERLRDLLGPDAPRWCDR